MTLSWLKGMKNGDNVQIHGVKTDLVDILIPSEIVQDDCGPFKNTLDKFGHHLYFKQIKNVSIFYKLNGPTQPLKTIKLVHLKEVSLLEVEKLENILCIQPKKKKFLFTSINQILKFTERFPWNG